MQPPPPVNTLKGQPRKPPDKSAQDEWEEGIQKHTTVATESLSTVGASHHSGTMQDTSPVRVIHCCKARTMPEGNSALRITALSMHDGHLGTLTSSPVHLCLDSGADITLISKDCYNALEHQPKLSKGMKLSLFKLTNQVKILGFINLRIFMPTTEGQVLEFVKEAYVIPGMNVPVLLGEDFQVNYKVSVLRTAQEMCLSINQPGEEFNIAAYSTPPLAEDFRV
jgi:hypothetical protein